MNNNRPPSVLFRVKSWRARACVCAVPCRHTGLVWLGGRQVDLIVWLFLFSLFLSFFFVSLLSSSSSSFFGFCFDLFGVGSLVGLYISLFSLSFFLPFWLVYIFHFIYWLFFFLPFLLLLVALFYSFRSVVVRH